MNSIRRLRGFFSFSCRFLRSGSSLQPLLLRVLRPRRPLPECARTTPSSAVPPRARTALRCCPSKRPCPRANWRVKPTRSSACAPPPVCGATRVDARSGNAAPADAAAPHTAPRYSARLFGILRLRIGHGRLGCKPVRRNRLGQRNWRQIPSVTPSSRCSVRSSGDSAR